MSFFTAEQIETMVSTFLVDSCEILRLSGDSYQPIATVKCAAKRDKVPQENVISDQIQSVQYWHVKVPLGTDVDSSDRLRVTGKDGTRTFSVNDTDKGRTVSPWLTCFCVSAE
jgi:hypothetical protein